MNDFSKWLPDHFLYCLRTLLLRVSSREMATQHWLAGGLPVENQHESSIAPVWYTLCDDGIVGKPTMQNRERR